MIGDASAAVPSAVATAAPASSSAPAGSATSQAAPATQPGNAARAQSADEAPAAGAFDLLLAAVPAATTAASVPPAPATESDPPAEAGAAADPGANPWLLLLAQLTPVATPVDATAAAAVAGDARIGSAAGMQTAPITVANTAVAQAMPAAGPAAGAKAANGADALVPFASLDLPTAGSTQPGAQSAAATTVSPAPDALPLPSSAMESTSAPVPLQALHAASAPTQAPAVATPSAPVPQPADPSAGYDDSFGTQVSWLAEQRIGQAEIRISPEHLGAIDIRLRVEGHEVRAEFHSAQPEVRQALEASLPRLRELLGQHGLQLGHAGVGQGHKPHDGTPFPPQSGPASRNEGDDVPPSGFRRARGLLDVYA